MHAVVYLCIFLSISLSQSQRLISTEETWTTSQNLTVSVRVTSTGRLTINPGVTVSLNNTYIQNAGGSIIALGTPNAPITITSNCFEYRKKNGYLSSYVGAIGAIFGANVTLDFYNNNQFYVACGTSTPGVCLTRFKAAFTEGFKDAAEYSGEWQITAVNTTSNGTNSTSNSTEPSDVYIISPYNYSRYVDTNLYYCGSSSFSGYGFFNFSHVTVDGLYQFDTSSNNNGFGVNTSSNFESLALKDLYILSLMDISYNNLSISDLYNLRPILRNTYKNFQCRRSQVEVNRGSIFNGNFVNCTVYGDNSRIFYSTFTKFSSLLVGSYQSSSFLSYYTDIVVGNTFSGNTYPLTATFSSSVYIVGNSFTNNFVGLFVGQRNGEFERGEYDFVSPDNNGVVFSSYSDDWISGNTFTGNNVSLAVLRSGGFPRIQGNNFVSELQFVAVAIRYGNPLDLSNNYFSNSNNVSGRIVARGETVIVNPIATSLFPQYSPNLCSQLSTSCDELSFCQSKTIQSICGNNTANLCVPKIGACTTAPSSCYSYVNASSAGSSNPYSGFFRTSGCVGSMFTAVNDSDCNVDCDDAGCSPLYNYDCLNRPECKWVPALAYCNFPVEVLGTGNGVCRGKNVACTPNVYTCSYNNVYDNSCGSLPTQQPVSYCHLCIEQLSCEGTQTESSCNSQPNCTWISSNCPTAGSPSGKCLFKQPSGSCQSRGPSCYFPTTTPIVTPIDSGICNPINRSSFPTGTCSCTAKLCLGKSQSDCNSRSECSWLTGQNYCDSSLKVGYCEAKEFINSSFGGCYTACVRKGRTSYLFQQACESLSQNPDFQTGGMIYDCIQSSCEDTIIRHVFVKERVIGQQFKKAFAKYSLSLDGIRTIVPSDMLLAADLTVSANAPDFTAADYSLVASILSSAVSIHTDLIKVTPVTEIPSLRRFIPTGGAQRTVAISLPPVPPCEAGNCTAAPGYTPTTCGNSAVPAPTYCARNSVNDCVFMVAPCAGVDVCSFANSSATCPSSACSWHTPTPTAATLPTVGFCLDVNFSCAPIKLCARSNSNTAGNSSGYYVIDNGCVPDDWVLVAPSLCNLKPFIPPPPPIPPPRSPQEILADLTISPNEINLILPADLHVTSVEISSDKFTMRLINTKPPTDSQKNTIIEAIRTLVPPFANYPISVEFVQNATDKSWFVIATIKPPGAPSPADVLANFQPTTEEILSAFGDAGISVGVKGVSVSNTSIAIVLASAPTGDTTKLKQDIITAIKNLNPNLKNYTLTVDFSVNSAGETVATVKVASPPDSVATPVPTPTPIPLGGIIGGIVAGVIVVAIIILVVVMVSRKKEEPEENDNNYTKL